MLLLLLLQMLYLPVLEKDTILRLEMFDHDAVNITSLKEMTALQVGGCVVVCVCVCGGRGGVGVGGGVEGKGAGRGCVMVCFGDVSALLVMMQ
jgi:hypothetical protein